LRAARKEFDALKHALSASGVEPSKPEYHGRCWKLAREILNLTWPRDRYIGTTRFGFAALDRKIHPWIRRLTFDLQIYHDARCTEALRGVKSNQELRDRWYAIENNQDSSEPPIWQAMLLFLLDKRPLQALEFLRVTGCDPDRDPLFLATAMEYLARLFTMSEIEVYGAQTRAVLVHTFHNIFRVHLYKHPMLCTQDLLSNITRLATRSTLPSIYDILSEHQAVMSHFTLLVWAEMFTNRGYIDRALQVLKRVATETCPPGFEMVLVESRAFKQSCTHLVNQCIKRKRDYHLIPQIIAELTKIGVKHGRYINNVIIKHGLAAGDYDTAFRVFNAMEENGIPPDGHTYSTLLSGCSRSDNPSIFRAFAERCRIKASELEDPLLAANYIHYLYAVTRLDGADAVDASALLLDSYAQFFELAPLQSLDAGLDPRSFPVGLNLPAEPLALFVILSNKIRAAQEFSNASVLQLYHSFRTASHPGNNPHPAIAALASTTYIYNAFLKAFCDNLQFASASALIADMTDAVDGLPQPGVIGWTIFMNAFFRNEQKQAAERVFEIMRSRGVEPSQVTWKVLLKMYAKDRRDVEKLVAILQNIDPDEDLDPKVMAVLAQLHQEKKLQYEGMKNTLNSPEVQEEDFDIDEIVWSHDVGEEEDVVEVREKWLRPKPRKDL
jgi:pentatricopeptide repeat protein